MSRFRKERRRPTLHMAPLIDCVLLLLIFFLLTATYINRGIPVNLPDTKGGEPIEKGLTITLTQDKKLFLNQEPVTLTTLEEILATHTSDKNKGITLRADQGVPVGRVVEVIDIARSLGSEVSLITESNHLLED